jgi:uncharacterized membrane protein
MDITYLKEAIICFLLTIIIEPLFFGCFGYKDKKFALNSILINVITNVCLNVLMYFILKYIPSNYELYFGILEILVFVIETIFYLIKFKKEWVLIPLTAAANALTLVIGILVTFNFIG